LLAPTSLIEWLVDEHLAARGVAVAVYDLQF